MLEELTRSIQRNCEISDARDSGVYSLCTLILKLRNLYKWEQNLDPWDEPETPVVLDWIEAKENSWLEIVGRDLQDLPLNGSRVDPYDLAAVNSSPELAEASLHYGAGYGRSLKAVFFLAEIRQRLEVNGSPVLVLGRELARELSAPFAMLQDGEIIIRREPLRFFLWDQVQEIRAASRLPLRHALRLHGVNGEHTLDQQAFREKLDDIVDAEIPIFIHHELGELRESGLDRSVFRELVAAFPNSPIELTARAVKDMLADTHPEGMLGFIVSEKREASLAFYLGLLDSMRKLLFPEIGPAFKRFLENRDWQVIASALRECRKANQARAEILRSAAGDLARTGADRIKCRLERDLLVPLGL